MTETLAVECPKCSEATSESDLRCSVCQSGVVLKLVQGTSPYEVAIFVCGDCGSPVCEACKRCGTPLSAQSDRPDAREVTWGLSPDKRHVRLQLPPVTMQGAARPELFVDFDARAVEDLTSRLLELRAYMLPSPHRV